MKTTITASTGGMGMFVNVEGLPDLMRFLRQSDPEMRAAVRAGIERAGSPVLASARANASAIADDGTFASSISTKSTARGALNLVSGDPAAGVKEFANPGAVTRTSKGSPLADSRLRMKSGVGVPMRANPPRAMVNAVADNVETVKGYLEDEIEKVLRGANA